MESVIVRTQPFEISVVNVGGSGVGKYRENILATLRCVPTDDFSHVRFNCHAHLMPRLMAGIVQHAVVYLLPFQIGNVYKRHSHSHETEHEYVASKGEVRQMVELQCEQLAYLFISDAAFGCLFIAGEDSSEGIVGNIACRPVVQATQ